MKTETRKNIYNFINKNFPVTIKNIVDEFGFSPQIIHRHIKKLLLEKKVYKTWAPPKVYYFPENDLRNIQTNLYNKEENDILNKNFVYFWANWELKYGSEGFTVWFYKRNLDPKKEIKIYIETLKKYSKYKDKEWFIEGTRKMKDTFEKIYLDKVFYLDFYSIEKYGKTLLWNLMLYSKQTNDKELAIKVLNQVKENIYKFVEKYNIDSFAFIPPSIDRKIQLIDELKKWLNLKLPELKLLKIFKNKPVPQKSLKSKNDRIINASETIFIWDNSFKWKNILLIDDAIWSWATLNETAKKIRQKNIAENIYGLAIVWSYKWFEVINEV